MKIKEFVMRNRLEIMIGLWALSFTILIISVLTKFIKEEILDGDKKEMVIDNTYNQRLTIKVTNDSIKIDSLNKDYEWKIEEVKRLNDSATIKLFIKLVRDE